MAHLPSHLITTVQAATAAAHQLLSDQVVMATSAPEAARTSLTGRHRRRPVAAGVDFEKGWNVCTGSVFSLDRPRK